MTRKVEQLILNGLSLLVELREPFIQEWKKILTVQHNVSLADEFDEMIVFAFQEFSKKDQLSAETFIFSLLSEWKNRFSAQQAEEEAIFLVAVIESIFHRLLKKRQNSTFLDHQSIQTLFSRILDHSVLTKDVMNRTEKCIKKIMTTNVVPIKWLAVVKKAEESFEVDKVVCKDNNQIPNHLVELCTGLKAKQIDHLTMAISRLLDSNINDTPTVQIPCLTDTLLIRLEDGASAISSQQIDFVRGMYFRQLKLHHLESNLEWKDASLLFLQRLLRSRTANDAVNSIVKGLIDYMPFQRCALFLYNHFEDKGIGVSGYNVNTSSVQQIREKIFQLPLIQKYRTQLSHSQPLFFTNAQEVLPEKYVREYKLTSIVVLPIYVPSESKLIGIVLLDQGENSQFEVSVDTVATLIKFGHYAGELLYSLWGETLQQFGSSNRLLTGREKEVLQLISEGSSINEAAETLHLSSYTVRDYVSIIIQKLSAKNRTDAAIKAFRMNLIH